MSMKMIARLSQNDAVFYALYQDGAYYRINEDCSSVNQVEAAPVSGEFRLLAPVSPSKIVALGANYRKHAAEMNLEIKPEPLIFLKPPSAVIAPLEQIRIANPQNRTDYEAELVVVIAKECSRVSAAQAKDYILGYTCGNDVSDRMQQKGDGQWTRAKGYDTYCPIGPHIVTGIDPENLRVQTILNGEIVQDGYTSEMITGVYDAVSFISHVMTLYPGDLIMTGTPDGIGPLHSGDTVEIRIEQVGSLVNTVG